MGARQSLEDGWRRNKCGGGEDCVETSLGMEQNQGFASTLVRTKVFHFKFTVFSYIKGRREQSCGACSKSIVLTWIFAFSISETQLSPPRRKRALLPVINSNCTTSDKMCYGTTNLVRGTTEATGQNGTDLYEDSLRERPDGPVSPLNLSYTKNII
jgi:hypothetical protein